MSDVFAMVLRTRMDRYFIAEIDVARALGVSPALVRKWRNGSAWPAREDLPMLARVLALPEAELAEIVGATEAISSAPLPEWELVERSARGNWAALQALPAPFRAPFLLAQVQANTAGMRERND